MDKALKGRDNVVRPFRANQNAVVFPRASLRLPWAIMLRTFGAKFKCETSKTQGRAFLSRSPLLPRARIKAQWQPCMRAPAHKTSLHCVARHSVCDATMQRKPEIHCNMLQDRMIASLHKNRPSPASLSPCLRSGLVSRSRWRRSATHLRAQANDCADCAERRSSSSNCLSQTGQDKSIAPVNNGETAPARF